MDEVEKLCNSGVIIFFVGVGFGVDRIEFEGMVFKFIYVFDVVMFNVLEFIREWFIKIVCEGRFFDFI